MKTWMTPCALILGFGLWKSVAFRQHWENHYLNVQHVLTTQQHHERALAFIAEHQKEVILLQQKGWRKPTKRVKVRQFLDSLSSAFQQFTYQYTPVETQQIGTHTFRTSRIILETVSSHDAPVYELLQILSQKFPGVIVVNKIKMQRKEFSLIHAQIHLEWVSLP